MPSSKYGLSSITLQRVRNLKLPIRIFTRTKCVTALDVPSAMSVYTGVGKRLICSPNLSTIHFGMKLWDAPESNNVLNCCERISVPKNKHGAMAYNVAGESVSSPILVLTIGSVVTGDFGVEIAGGSIASKWRMRGCQILGCRNNRNFRFLHLHNSAPRSLLSPGGDATGASAYSKSGTVVTQIMGILPSILLLSATRSSAMLVCFRSDRGIGVSESAYMLAIRALRRF